MQAFYANCNSDKTFTADDFMGKKQPVSEQYPSDEQLELDLVNIFGCGPGKE